MNNEKLSGRDWGDSSENSSPEDVGSRSLSYESMVTGNDNQDHVSDPSCPCDNAVFSNFFEDYTMRLSGAAARYFENMTHNDLEFLSSTFGFGENYRPNLGVICGDHIFENVGNYPSKSRKHIQYQVMKDYPKKNACAKPKKRPVCKPKPKRCSKPKPKKVCAKPKPKKVCAKPKPKKRCAKPKPKAKKVCKPKRKPVCPRVVKPKCSKPSPGGQTSLFGMANKSPEASIKESRTKEN